MRTTVTLDPDVAEAVGQVQREQHVGVSAAVNSLVRRGLLAHQVRAPFVQRTSDGHARLDVSNVAEVLDLVEGPGAR